METNPNIIRLLEMLENPEAYSEQEIQDIVNRDEDTRRAYRLMVAAKQGYASQQAEPSTDAEAAWERFEREKLSERSRVRFLHFRFGKVAAMFIGILFVTGFAFAAIHLSRSSAVQGAKTTDDTIAVQTAIHPAEPSPEATPLETGGEAITFDNVSLDSIAKDIAAYHHVPIEIENEGTRQLRFYFVWNQKDSLLEVVEKLNMFEHVTMAVEDGKLIVR